MEWGYVVSPGTIVGEAHASTLVETASGDMLCAWFGGAPENDPRTAIWSARRANGRWGAASVIADEPGAACFNPVFYRDDDRFWLFWKAGPDPQRWTGFLARSADDGRTWGASDVLPAGFCGPTRTKPIRLSDGRIVVGGSNESYRCWSSWIGIFDPKTERWAVRGPLVVPGQPFGLIQPAPWEVKSGHIRVFLRSTQTIGRICMAESVDGGEMWSDARPTALPNPNSGIDALKLADGRLVLVYNHTTRYDVAHGRAELHIAVSADDGETWSAPWLLEGNGRELSYPAAIEGRDGTVHVSWTWNRIGIMHASFDPDEIGRIADGSLKRP